MKAVALVGRVTDVQPHPDNAELNNKMDIVTISGRTNVANRPSPDEPRYKVGDFAVMLTENTIVPDWLMKHLGMWNEQKNEGMLGGKKKNRLRPRAMGLTTKITSEVALCPCWWTRLPDGETEMETGLITQEGYLHFIPEIISDWPQTDIDKVPVRHVIRYLKQGAGAQDEVIVGCPVQYIGNTTETTPQIHTCSIIEEISEFAGTKYIRVKDDVRIFPLSDFQYGKALPYANFILIGPVTGVQVDDDFSPEGQDVAWNLGIEEIHEGQ